MNDTGIRVLGAGWRVGLGVAGDWPVRRTRVDAFVGLLSKILARHQNLWANYGSGRSLFSRRYRPAAHTPSKLDCSPPSASRGGEKPTKGGANEEKGFYYFSADACLAV